MNENLSEKEIKRKNRKRLRKRFFFFFCAFFVLFLWTFNHYCITREVPHWMIRAVTKTLAKAGHHIETQQVKFSFTEGFAIKEFSYYEDASGIKFNAPKLFIECHPHRIFKGVFCPFSFVIINGNAVVPILPETGKEGKHDLLHLKNINMKIQGRKGHLKVEKTSARVGNFAIGIHGTINNLLHIILENIFMDLWEQNKAGKKLKLKKYPFGLMQMFPIGIREKLIQSYHNINEISMKEQAECQISFHIDANEFKKCTIESRILLPEFQIGTMKIRGIQQEISLRNGIIELDDVSFDFGNHSRLTATGTYQNTGEIFSGSIKGSCKISDLIHFMKPELKKEIGKHIVFKDEKVSFNGVLEYFTISGNRFKGNLNLTLPEITVNSIRMKQVNLHVRADENMLEGEIKNAQLDDGNLTGKFSIRNTGEIFCEAQGKAKLLTFREIFPKEASSFLQKNITHQQKEAPFEFFGRFRSDSRKLKRYSGSASIRYPHVCLNGVEIRKINADLEYTPEAIHISKISAETADGSKFSGALNFDLSNHQITAKIIASGVPDKMAKAFDTIWKTDSLTSLAKDISSPDKKRIAECDMELFAAYGKTPFYQISGNVVMRNLTYCGIPFQYGAARFIVDSTDRLVVPDLILKSKDGIMQMESIYYLNEPEKIDILHFKLKSSIQGNALITMFCPEGYKPMLIDFPAPMNVTAEGVIDYINQEKTTIRAAVQNGVCMFAGAKLTDIDAVLNMKKNEIFFNDAKMTFCKGDVNASFRYNIKKENGHFKQTLERADLLELLRQFNASDMLPAGTGNGELAFQSSGNFECKGNDIFIDGKGKLDLNGDDLWNIPIMKDFLKYTTNAWSMLGDGVGITRISSKILFQKEKAVIEQVKANGSFVSMDADGEFHWNTGEYDVTVYAELLKSALPFEIASKILRPVSLMLKKNFKGKYKMQAGK